MKQKTRVIIADDHVMVAEGLRNLLAENCDVLACVNDGGMLVEAAKSLAPDVIVTDLTMPGLNGMDAIRTLREAGVVFAAVIVTMHADPYLAAAAIQDGASAYIVKHSAGSELLHAVHEARAGRVYISSMIDRSVIERYTKGQGRGHMSEMLTLRQRRIVQLSAEGHSLKNIARQLKISRRTVESHKYKVMQKLSVHSTAELVQLAIRLGLISVPAGNLGEREKK